MWSRVDLPAITDFRMYRSSFPGAISSNCCQSSGSTCGVMFHTANPTHACGDTWIIQFLSLDHGPHVCELALVDVPKCFGGIGPAEEYSCMVVLFFLPPSLWSQLHVINIHTSFYFSICLFINNRSFSLSFSYVWARSPANVNSFLFTYCSTKLLKMSFLGDKFSI